MAACSTPQCCSRHPRSCAVARRPSPAGNGNEVAASFGGGGGGSGSDAEAIALATKVLRSAASWPRGDLAISHTNAGNLPFARNWWRHLRSAGVDNLALLATDDEAYAALLRELPSRSVRLPRSIFTSHESGASHKRYRSAGWTKLMFAVPLMVNFVLSLGLSVLWMDTDVVALSNPFPVIHAQLEELKRQGGSEGEGVLLASVDGRVPDEDLAECGRAYSASERWGRSAGGWKLCGGLFYLQHGRASARFLREWERRLHGPGAGAKNQPHYNEALRAGASELTMRLLPCDLFPNGYRYASDPWRRAQRRAPLLVHNNWIKGHEAKVARFRKWGMWQGELANRTQLLGST